MCSSSSSSAPSRNCTLWEGVSGNTRICNELKLIEKKDLLCFIHSQLKLPDCLDLNVLPVRNYLCDKLYHRQSPRDQNWRIPLIKRTNKQENLSIPVSTTLIPSISMPSTIKRWLSTLHQRGVPAPPPMFVAIVTVLAMAPMPSTAQGDMDPNVQSPVACGNKSKRVYTKISNNKHVSLCWCASAFCSSILIEL